MEYTKGEWKALKRFPPSPLFNVFCDGKDGVEIIATKVKEANAHLIASAPDLYEALKVYEMFSGLSLERQDREAFAKAHKALLKAEGK